MKDSTWPQDRGAVIGDIQFYIRLLEIVQEFWVRKAQSVRPVLRSHRSSMLHVSFFPRVFTSITHLHLDPLKLHNTLNLSPSNPPASSNHPCMPQDAVRRGKCRKLHTSASPRCEDEWHWEDPMRTFIQKRGRPDCGYPLPA